MKILKVFFLTYFVFLLKIDAQPSGGWRSAWNITISAEEVGKDNIPKVIKVVINNRTDEVLVGGNLIFTIYPSDSMLGWCFDDSIINNEIKLQPNEELVIKLYFKNLDFQGLEGENLETKKVLKYLSEVEWRIRASMMDIKTPKPMTESSLSVYSNMLIINKQKTIEK